jgi:hypothetical protein
LTPRSVPCESSSGASMAKYASENGIILSLIFMAGVIKMHSKAK